MADPQFVQYETKVEGTSDDNYSPWPQPTVFPNEELGETWDTMYWGLVYDGEDYASQVGPGTDLVGFSPGLRLTVRARSYTPGAPFGAWSAEQTATVGALINVTQQPVAWAGAVGQSNGFTADHDGTSQQWVRRPIGSQGESSVTDIVGETAKSYSYTAIGGDVPGFEVALKCEVGAAYIYSDFVQVTVTSDALAETMALTSVGVASEIFEDRIGSVETDGGLVTYIPRDDGTIHSVAADVAVPWRARESAGSYFADTADGFEPMLRSMPAYQQLDSNIHAFSTYLFSAGITYTTPANTVMTGIAQEGRGDSNGTINDSIRPDPTDCVNTGPGTDVFVFLVSSATDEVGVGVTSNNSLRAKANYIYSTNSFSWHTNTDVTDSAAVKLTSSLAIIAIAISRPAGETSWPQIYPAGYQSGRIGVSTWHSRARYRDVTALEAIALAFRDDAVLRNRDQHTFPSINFVTDDVCYLMRVRLPGQDYTTDTTILQWGTNERLYFHDDMLKLTYNGQTLECAGVDTTGAVNAVALNVDTETARITIRCNGGVNTLGAASVALDNDLATVTRGDASVVVDTSEIQKHENGTFAQRRDLINSVIGDPDTGPPPGPDPTGNWDLKLGSRNFGQGGVVNGVGFPQQIVDNWKAYPDGSILGIQRLGTTKIYVNQGWNVPIGTELLLAPGKVFTYYKHIIQSPNVGWSVRDGVERHNAASGGADTNVYGTIEDNPHLVLRDNDGVPIVTSGVYGARGNYNLDPNQGHPTLTAPQWFAECHLRDNQTRTENGYTKEQVTDGWFDDAYSTHYPSSQMAWQNGVPAYPTSAQYSDAKIWMLEEFVKLHTEQRGKLWSFNAGFEVWSDPNVRYVLDGLNSSDHKPDHWWTEFFACHKAAGGDMYLEGRNNLAERMDCIQNSPNIRCFPQNGIKVGIQASWETNQLLTSGNGPTINLRDLYVYLLCVYYCARLEHTVFCTMFKDFDTDADGYAHIMDHTNKAMQIVAGAPLEGYRQVSQGSATTFWREWENFIFIANANVSTASSVPLGKDCKDVDHTNWNANGFTNGAYDALPTVTNTGTIPPFHGKMFAKNSAIVP